MAHGEADVAATELPVATFLIRTLSLTNLEIATEVVDVGGRPQRYRLAVRKDGPLWVPILEKAMDTLTVQELKELDDRWITLPKSVDVTGSVDLTPEEQTWLNDHPVIRVHNEWNWPPFNFNKDGKPLGLSIDYMNLLASRIGIEVTFTSGEWGELLDQAFDKKLDVMRNIVKTLARQKNLFHTD